MDIYCPKCGEPFDHDCLHEEAEARMHGAPAEGPVYQETYQQVKHEFYREGCGALKAFGAKCSPAPDTNAASLAAMVYELSGDDLDGAAADLEDAEMLGLL